MSTNSQTPTNHPNAVCSWSGGKDSCYALIKAIEAGYQPAVLLNVLNEQGQISRSHGLPAGILQQQAQQAGLPLQLISSSWQDYEMKFTGALHALKEQYQLSYAVFGDIDLQAHRDWEEKVCHAAGLKALLPLWQQDRKALVIAMLNAGIETMIVSCNAVMGKRFIGRHIDLPLLEELESLGIDPCGENGEYHTLVLNCSLFKAALQVNILETVEHEGYWFAVFDDKAKKIHP